MSSSNPLEMTQTEIENDVGAEFSNGLIGGYLQSSPGTFKERIKRLNVAQLDGLKDEINHLIDEAKVIAGKVKHAVDHIAHLSSKEPDGVVVEDSKKIEGSLHYSGAPFGLKVRPSMTVKGFRVCIKKAHPPHFKTDLMLKGLMFVVEGSGATSNTSGGRSLAKFGVCVCVSVKVFTSGHQR